MKVLSVFEKIAISLILWEKNLLDFTKYLKKSIKVTQSKSCSLHFLDELNVLRHGLLHVCKLLFQNQMETKTVMELLSQQSQNKPVSLVVVVVVGNKRPFL